MKISRKLSYGFAVKLQAAAGIDVHKDFFQVAICKQGYAPIDLRVGTFTKDLRQLAEILRQHQIGHAIMESTGVYWKPLYRVLSDAGIEVTVVNAYRVKQLPMEKTDKKDARWLARLLISDMVKPSFVAAEQQESLRVFSRMRTRYIRQSTSIKNQIVKILEQANYKVRSIVSDISTHTGMQLVQALSEGVTDAEQLLLLCHKSVLKRQGIQRLLDAFCGLPTPTMQQTLKMLLADLKHIQSQKTNTDIQIRQLLNEYQQHTIQQLTEVEGIATQQAEIITAEIGAGIEAFAHADAAAKYAGLTPGQHESADKRKNTRAVPGNQYLRTNMVQVAWAAIKVKNGYWQATYQHLKKRLGAKKAILAIARKMFKVVFKIMAKAYAYQRWDNQVFTRQLKNNHPYKTTYAPALSHEHA
jgi:transposase